MKHYFFATLTAVLELSDEEFSVLFYEAENHYDYKVKSSTQPGGILYGFRNRRSFAIEAGTPENEVEFIERELGLMMKALEMTRKEEGIKLYERFLTIAKELQLKTVEVNKPINDIKFTGHFIKG